MSDINPYTQKQDVYDEAFSELYTQDETYEALDLDLDDDTLLRLAVRSLDEDRAHWNKKPWILEDTDEENTAFILGDQIDDKDYLKNDVKYIDNRLFTSIRAILSYVTGQLAKPEITPSRSDEIYLKAARDIGSALYQHSLDEKVDYKVRAAVMNLITRKRGFLKLRWDPHKGLNGDIVTDVCNPEDIIIDRFAGYLENPGKIYHRLRCSIEELCAKFPDKKEQIWAAYGIIQGRQSQVSRMITYFECWFTYTNDSGQPAEGVCWFIHEKNLILDKMKNPNWIYLSSDKKEKQANVMSCPPKPFVPFNYINTGHSYIDETCLVEQARPMQRLLNKRGRQIWENADYQNGRWVADKNAFSQEDARNLINKGAKTIALADFTKNNTPLQNVAPQGLPNYVYNTLLDARQEIDNIMGTPSQFRGAQPESQDTLGRDLMIKQQAGALQDDLVAAVAMSMETYYTIKLQMMRVYYTDDYWFQMRGGDGKYEFILLNGEKLDSDVKVGVQTDSTLPLDKASIRQTAMSLWSAGHAIDYKTLMEDLGLPNPDIRAERYLKSVIDPLNYLKSVEVDQIDDDAETDIQLLIMNKTPEERDNYDENYFNYVNRFMASNRFNKLIGQNPKAAQRIVAFVMAIQHVMTQSAQLQGSITDQAGIVNDPMGMPLPKQTIQIRADPDPMTSDQIAAQAAGIPLQNAQAQAVNQPPTANQNPGSQQAGPPVPTQ